MDFITRENVVLHETIWHKLAEKNLYTVDGNNRVPATSIPSDIK